jgi:hypothetical protein
MIKSGTIWADVNSRRYVVLGVLPIEDKMWVHYRLEKQEDHLPNEFSCYEESFLSRFTPIVNE